MWYLSLIHLTALLTYISLTLYILMRRPLTRLHLSLATFIVCLAIWSLEQLAFTSPAMNRSLLSLWNLIGSVGWIGLSPTLLWFVLVVTGNDRKSPHFALLTAVTAIAIVLITAQSQQLIIDDYIRMPYGWNTHWADTPWAIAFFIYYVLVVVISLILLMAYLRKPSGPSSKRHAKLLFIFTWIGFGLGSLTDTVAPLMGLTYIPSLGNVMCLVWATALGYAIAKHRFLTLSPSTAAEKIISTMSDLLILTDIQGRIVRVNRSVETCLGWPQAGLTNRFIGDLIADKVDPDQPPLFEDSPPDRIDNQRTQLKTRNGKQVPAILSSAPIMDGGQPAGYVTIIKDISQIEKAEAALKKSEARFRELVESINEVVFSINYQGDITYLSPAFENLTGFTSEAFRGRPITDLIDPGDLDNQKRQLRQIFEGRVKISRCKLKRKDGSFCWVQASSRPFRSKGRVIGANGILTDISEQVDNQKEKEILMARLAQAEKMEAIGKLAGAVAHDLNNVLSGVVSYPELMLLDLPKGSRLRKMTKTIMRSGMKAAAIVEDLLTLARRGVIQKESVNINQIINDYLTSPEYENLRAASPNVLISVTLEPSLDNIAGSSVHLAKTVMNLMTNAFEALPEEGGRITITTQKSVMHGSPGINRTVPCVVLRIKDTGLGIAPEDQERIFEPFFTRKVMGRSGTGLGMAVVWGAIKDHRGQIDLISAPGKGTEFILRFPSIPGTAMDESY